MFNILRNSLAIRTMVAAALFAGFATHAKGDDSQIFQQYNGPTQEENPGFLTRIVQNIRNTGTAIRFATGQTRGYLSDMFDDMQNAANRMLGAPQAEPLIIRDRSRWVYHPVIDPFILAARDLKAAGGENYQRALRDSAIAGTVLNKLQIVSANLTLAYGSLKPGEERSAAKAETARTQLEKASAVLAEVDILINDFSDYSVNVFGSDVALDHRADAKAKLARFRTALDNLGAALVSKTTAIRDGNTSEIQSADLKIDAAVKEVQAMGIIISDDDITNPDYNVIGRNSGYIENPSELNQFIHNFKISIEEDEDGYGQVVISGKTHPQCADRLTFTMDEYDADKKVWPLSIYKGREFCTEQKLRECMSTRTCVDVAEYASFEGLDAGLDRDGQVKLAVRGLDMDSDGYRAFPGLEAYLTPETLKRREEERAAAAIAREWEDEVAAICEGAENGDRDSIMKLLELGIFDEQTVQELIDAANTKDREKYEEKLENIDSLSELDKFIKDISKYAKKYPDLKEDAVDLLIAASEKALELDDDSDDENSKVGAKQFKYARRALKAAKKLGKKGAEVRKAIAKLDLEEARFAARSGDEFYHSMAKANAAQSYNDLIQSYAYSRNRDSEVHGLMTEYQRAFELRWLPQTTLTPWGGLGTKLDEDFLKSRQTVDQELSGWASGSGGGLFGGSPQLGTGYGARF